MEMKYYQIVTIDFNLIRKSFEPLNKNLIN